MALKPLLAVALLSALALAGCSGGGDGGGSSTSSTSAAPNRPPAASLNATAVNGTAPLNVTFALDGHDADKDALNWTLTFAPSGDAANGTSLPANVTRSFAKGNYTVTLTVSDGRLNATAVVNVTVSEAGAVATPEPLGHFEGSASAPCPGCPVQYNVCLGLYAGQNEVQCYYFDLPEGAAGHAAVFANEAGPVSADFMTTCDGLGDGVDYFADEASPHEAEVPDGATCVVVYDSSNPSAAFTIDIL
jgi:PKD repeat protein